MKVYGHPMSPYTQKVLCTLAEKQHPAEFVLVDIFKGEPRQPPHLLRHPFGLVPVLEDDGYTLYEGRAIIRYLDARLPGAALTPRDAREMGRMEQWISVEHSYFTPGATDLILEVVLSRRRGRQPDPAVVQKGRAGVEKALDVLDRALGESEYLAGGQFSLAEICYLPYLEYFVACGAGDLITSRPHVAAWWQRISQRPSWQQAIGKTTAQ